MTASTAVSEDQLTTDSEDEKKEDPLASIGDLDTILPPPGKIVIDGVDCHVKHLKAREFFALMGVITDGLGPAMMDIKFESQDPNEVAGVLAGALFLALPNATNQFLGLVQVIVIPEGTKEENRRVREYLQDPEVEDLFPVIDAILENEKDNFASLVGKARAYMGRWKQQVNHIRQRL